MKKTIVNAIILENKEIAKDIFSMTIKAKELSQSAKPGQFVKLYIENNKNLLPRPISICEIDKSNETLRLVYQILGEGTLIFSNMKAGDKIKVLGNCGNGYKLNENGVHILVGGGIGIPPLLETCKQLTGEKIVVLGFRTGEFLKKEFQDCGAKVYIATDDGSSGFKGNVSHLMKEKNIVGDYIYSCGPNAMLEALTEYAKEKNIEAQVSVEERMACGLGTCICCTVKIIENGEEVYKRVCKDGPIFNSLEVVYK